MARGQGQVRLLMSGLVEKGVAVTLASPPDGELARRTASLAITQRPLHAEVAGTDGAASCAGQRRVRHRTRRGARTERGDGRVSDYRRTAGAAS